MNQPWETARGRAVSAAWADPMQWRLLAPGVRPPPAKPGPTLLQSETDGLDLLPKRRVKHSWHRLLPPAAPLHPLMEEGRLLLRSKYLLLLRLRVSRLIEG